MANAEFFKADSIKLGTEATGVLLALWFNLQYSRFMKFWVEPPYKAWTEAIFRVFFALCFGGAFFSLIQDIIQTERSKQDYLEALKFGIGWSVALIAVVYLAEYDRRSKRRREREGTSGK
jgi:hypothetical protein